MPNDLNRIEATSGPKARKKASTVVRLVQIAALAAVLVPLGSVAAEATPLNFSPTMTSGTAFFDFGSETAPEPFDFTLAFNTVVDSFSVDVEAAAFSALDQLAEPAPAGSVCIPIAGAGECVDFTATTTASASADFHSYTVSIDWTFPTDPNFPNTGGEQVQLLESHAGGPFTNITVPGSYFSGCPAEFCPDPGISGQSDSFSFYTVVDTTVPEPATCALLGSGLAGLLMRYRRRERQGPDAGSSRAS